MDEYLDHDAMGLAELVRTKQVSPAELLAAAQARADAVNPRINAIVRRLDPPVSRAGVEAPFYGVPFLFKDLDHHLAGHPTGAGSRAWQSYVHRENDVVSDRWLAAGLVVFGRTNTPEFGAKGITEPLVGGPTRNPWNLDHAPGGSSGGSAAAVAAGIVPCSAASDGGGSIRIPASACGVFGLKATRGLIPAGPQLGEGLLGSVSNGVHSRSVRDTAAMLDVLAGPSPTSPYLAARPATPLREEIGRDPGRLRVAVCTDSAINPKPDPEAITAAEATATLLESLGHQVERLPRMPYDDAALAKDFLTTWFAWCAWQVAQSKRITGAGDEGFEPDTLVMAALGRATKPVDLVAAIENRQRYVRSMAAFFETHDLLLTPTTATAPPRIGAFDLPPLVQRAQAALIKGRSAGILRFTPVVDQMITQNLGWVPYTQLANLTGLPAMSVPLHWTPAGLPIGSQFVGRLGSEAMLLRLASQLEAAQPWWHRRPLVI
ncbi:MAG: amidase [Actinobacteria bacterium]|uniref:Amidase n=1 Tax=Nostocoides veronense TaxID=330836 RepID=A0ABP4Y2M9_9MICO|nr:amidase [Actinomycetota bacterium]